MPRKRRTVVARKKPIRTTSGVVARRKRKTPIHGVVVDQYGNGWLTDKVKAGYNAVKGRLGTYARDTARRAVADADRYLKRTKPISSYLNRFENDQYGILERVKAAANQSGYGRKQRGGAMYGVVRNIA